MYLVKTIFMMKELTIIFLFIWIMPSIYAQNQTQKDDNSYEKNYYHKIKIISQTESIIKVIVEELKENHFEKNEQVKSLVTEAFKALFKGEKFQKQYLQDAKVQKWKNAFFNAEAYWQQQVKAADLLLQAKKILKAD